jgi:hypothetical protein
VEPTEPSVAPGPPADPEEWDDTTWIAWLKATDREVEAGAGGLPATAAGRMVHSAGGQVLGQSMIGLARAIYGPQRNLPAIVIEANSEPESERLVALHLDAEHPEQSTVVVRPEARE